ncbi:MAG: hypothetical protein WCF19_02550 [Chlamydiales bacterium]
MSALICAFPLYPIHVPFHRTLKPHPNISAPWFTGPLLAPSALTIPFGHYNIEPYIYGLANTGAYDGHWQPVKKENFWNNYFQTLLAFGVNNWADFQCNPTLFYNYSDSSAKWALGDMPIAFDFQLYHPTRTLTEWNVAVKLTLKETLPLGKYRNLDPKKRLTDVGGMGSWQTAASLVVGNMFYLGRSHFLTWRTSFQYTWPAPVYVKNLNVYGGEKGTRGTVYPAQNFQIDSAIEVNLTQHWAFAMDIVGAWSGKTRFKGKTAALNAAPPGAQFSLAPAIEYNFNANIGIIFGPWFTLGGRNAIEFASGVFAFNYYN